MNSSTNNSGAVKPKDSASAKRRLLLSAFTLSPIVTRMANAASSSVKLHYAQKHQVVEGFGTCVNTWQTDVAAAYQQENFLRFYRETLGASALRVALAGEVAQIARERWQDISWRDFQFKGSGVRGAVITEVAKRLHLASQGSLRIIASAWTPPAWMKVNQSLGNGHPKRKNFALDFDHPVERSVWAKPLGGEEGAERYAYLARNKLRRDRYLHFARLLVEWTRYFKSLGITLYALSPANEPRFSHWFESCVYTPDEYAELVEVIAWMFANQSEPLMPIFGPEHMTRDIAGNRLYLDALVRRTGAMQPLTAIASHGYVDGYAADLRRESTVAFGKLVASYGKKIWVTEGGFGGHEWPAPLHQLGASFMYALRDGGGSLLMTWQTLTRHPPNENGLMTLRGPTKKTYAAMQFWRFIRPGMVRIGVESNGMLDAAGFENPISETTILVLLNRTKNTSPVSLRLIGKRLAAIDALFITDKLRNCAQVTDALDPRALSIPPEAIATLVLKTSPTAQ